MFTAEDLTNVENAIREIISGARTVSFAMSGNTATYQAADLPQLQELRKEIRTELAFESGAAARRTYAKQGGRG